MAIHPNARICSQVKVNGTRCGSPALRGEIFCYFHQRMIRGVHTPPDSRLHPMAILEDEQSIQASLMEVINALVRNQIDISRARLILRALHIAVKNSSRAHFWTNSEMVSEVPEYPAVPEAAKPPDPALEKAAVLAKINRPKPHWPADYGITAAQAAAWGFPPEEFDPPSPAANANAPEPIKTEPIKPTTEMEPIKTETAQPKVAAALPQRKPPARARAVAPPEAVRNPALLSPAKQAHSSTRTG